MNLIIGIIISAVVLFGMAKKTENKWRQLSLLAAGKAAVNLQRAGETIHPCEMYFASAICMASKFDLERILFSSNENGWIPDSADVLVIEDARPSKTAIMITSKPLVRFFTGIAADAIDGGAISRSEKIVGDGFAGLLEIVELDPEALPVFELGKGDKKYSPYFVIERGVDLE
jgi:hypothetical protein